MLVIDWLASPDADPVTRAGGQPSEQLLLEGDAVLGLVLQDHGPASAEPGGQVLVGGGQVDGEAHHVVEVDAAEALDEQLVAGVELGPDAQQPQGQVLRLPAVPGRGEQAEEPVRVQAAVLGGGDHGAGDLYADAPPPALPAGPSLSGAQGLPAVPVLRAPLGEGAVDQLLLGTVAQDPQVRVGAGVARPGLDDAEGQAVEGANLVPRRGQPAAGQGPGDARPQGVGGGGLVGDHQGPAGLGQGTLPAAAAFQQRRREVGDGRGLAAAGDRRDPHEAALVLEDAELPLPGPEDVGGVHAAGSTGPASCAAARSRGLSSSGGPLPSASLQHR